MPYPNFHSFRIISPENFQSNTFRTIKIIDGITAITGRRKGKTTTDIQAYRFNKDKYNITEAKKWLKDHNIKWILEEPASGENSNYNSKMENEYFPIAAVGKYPQGNLTENIFDEIVNSFNPELHEPPITLGHIRDEHNTRPAMGWITEIKRIGNTLYAKAKQVWDEFDKLVKAGRYKKRSIGLRKNNKGKLFLHHLAFLGSMTPAVEGMPDIYFGGKADINFSSSDPNNQVNYSFESNNFNKFKKGGKMPFTQEDIDKAVKAAEEKRDADFSASLKQEKEKAKKEGKQQADKEYNEKIKVEKDRLKHESEVDEFCNQGIKEGYITPAMIKTGLKDLLFSMSERNEIEFCERNEKGEPIANKKIKSSDYELLTSILKEYKVAIEKGISDPSGAEDDKSNPNPNTDDKKYSAEKKKIKEYMKENKGASYGEALKAVRIELSSNN